MTGSAAAAVFLAVTGLPALADTLDDIIARGKVVVASRPILRPGDARAGGRLVGMEHDMVADFARRLSEAAGKTVAVEKVVVVAANRMQFLAQGKTDMFIATMSNKPDRARSSGSSSRITIRPASPFSRTRTRASAAGLR